MARTSRSRACSGLAGVGTGNKDTRLVVFIPLIWEVAIAGAMDASERGVEALQILVVLEVEEGDDDMVDRWRERRDWIGGKRFVSVSL